MGFSQIWSILGGKEQSLDVFCLGDLLNTNFLIDRIYFESFVVREM